MSPDYDQKIRVMIMWADHSIESGCSATDVLEQVYGGWNPPTIRGLRRVLAKRCGLAPPMTSFASSAQCLKRLLLLIPTY